MQYRIERMQQLDSVVDLALESQFRLDPVEIFGDPQICKNYTEIKGINFKRVQALLRRVIHGAGSTTNTKILFGSKAWKDNIFFEKKKEVDYLLERIHFEVFTTFDCPDDFCERSILYDVVGQKIKSMAA